MTSFYLQKSELLGVLSNDNSAAINMLSNLIGQIFYCSNVQSNEGFI